VQAFTRHADIDVKTRGTDALMFGSLITFASGCFTSSPNSASA
jgi:hypothetical protein